MKEIVFKNGTVIEFAEKGEPLEFKGSDYNYIWYIHPRYGLVRFIGYVKDKKTPLN